MLHEHESSDGEFVLDTSTGESFLGHKIAALRWRLPLLSRFAQSRANQGNQRTPFLA